MVTRIKAGDIFALRSDFQFFTPVPTRWGDADAFGHINNAMFLRYLENGRLDYFHQLCSMSMVPGTPHGFVLANIDISFARQVHHPVTLEVASRITRLGNSSFDLQANIYMPEDDKPVITSNAVCVWYDFNNDCSMSIPDETRQTIVNYEAGLL